MQADDVCAELAELQAGSLRGVREGQRLAATLQGLQATLQESAGTCAGTQAALKERAEELELSMDEGRSMGGEIDGLLDGLTRLLTQGVHAAAPVRELCASLSHEWRRLSKRYAWLSGVLLPQVLHLQVGIRELGELLSAGQGGAAEGGGYVSSACDSAVSLVGESVDGGGTGGEGRSAAGGSGEGADTGEQVLSNFLAQLQRSTEALYPMLLNVGVAAAAAAGAATEGASADSTLEAAEDSSGASTAKMVGGLAGGGGSGSNGGAAAAGKTWKQEKNMHALMVLRQIKCKLDGRDRWPGKERETKQSVAEQVEMVCRAATSIENLSQLYEGWAAWV